MQILENITEEHFKLFDDHGFVKLGRVISDAQLSGLQQRIDDIMLGKANLDYSQLLMQLDRAALEYDKVGPQTKGHKGATLAYRKIQDLEFDPLFLQYMQLPVFRQACSRIYGPQTPISCHRAMFMNKPAEAGSVLPWHQDAWDFLDRPPLLTAWMPLDPVTRANGCVQIIPGSHRSGWIEQKGSGFLNKEKAAHYCREEDIEYLEMDAGESMLLHNWTLHRSDVNKTDKPRRAFSVNYMDAASVGRADMTFSIIFGPGALTQATLQGSGGQERA